MAGTLILPLPEHAKIYTAKQTKQIMSGAESLVMQAVKITRIGRTLSLTGNIYAKPHTTLYQPGKSLNGSTK